MMHSMRMSVAQAAQILGKNPQYVRVGLQTGRLPFGSAVKLSEWRWSYHISPARFWEYVGKEKTDEKND